MTLCFSSDVEHSHCPLLSVSVVPSVRLFWHLFGADPQALLELAITLSPHSQIAWECIPQCFSSCHNRVWIGRALSTTTFPTSPRQIGLRIPVILVSLWWERGANWWRLGFMSMSIILTHQGLLFIGSWRHRQVKQYEVLQKCRDVLGKITSNIRQFKKTSQMHVVGNNCWTRAECTGKQ